jgi:hypothetical protein
MEIDQKVAYFMLQNLLYVVDNMQNLFNVDSVGVSRFWKKPCYVLEVLCVVLIVEMCVRLYGGTSGFCCGRA